MAVHVAHDLCWNVYNRHLNAYAFLLPDLSLLLHLFSQSICSPCCATCARCVFHTFTTSSSGVSGVRIVNMIYGPSCWPGGKYSHSTGQDTPHFTPAMPSQALCRQYGHCSQFLSILSPLCFSSSLKHTHKLPKELQKNRKSEMSRDKVISICVQTICKNRLKTQTIHKLYCH